MNQQTPPVCRGRRGWACGWACGWASLLTASVMVLCATAALADKITVNGIATDGVEVIGIRDGRLVYLTPAGAEVKTSLSGIDALEMERYPAYAQAVQGLKDGEFKQAAKQLQGLMSKAARDAIWVRQFAAWRLVQALDGAGSGQQATKAFAQLAATKPDAFFLAGPPITSAAQLTGNARTKTTAMLEKSLRQTNAAGTAAIEKLLTTLREAPPQPAAPAEGTGGTGGTGETQDAPANTEQAGENPDDSSAVVLPVSLTSVKDPVVELLKAGQFNEALTQVNQQLSHDRSRLQQRLYLRAVAQLGIAERSGRREDFLDAGLGFMRVVVLSRSGGTYLGPAVLEAAYIHQRLDEPQIAAVLIDEAGLLLDEEDEPRYYQRYQDLLSR